MELLGKSKEELRAMCVAMGEPAYRGGQIYHALYAERKLDLGVDDEFAGCAARDACEESEHFFACRETAIHFDGWIGAVFVLS